MTDEPKANENPVKETQDAPMPGADQKTGEVKDPKVDAPKEVTTQEEGLPDTASERTKHEFDKLQKQLRDERSRREYLEQTFQSMQTKQPETLQPLVDENGYLVPEAVSQRDKIMMEAQERAKRAEGAISSYMEHAEKLEAYKAHPEADPDSKGFDPEMKKDAAAYILSSMVNPQEYGGRQLGLKEAYDYIKTRRGQTVESAKTEGAKEAIEKLSPKEQAALDVGGNANRRSELNSNIDDLRRQTRKGNMDAVVERLKHIPSEG